jgi:virulence factor
MFTAQTCRRKRIFIPSAIGYDQFSEVNMTALAIIGLGGIAQKAYLPLLGVRSDLKLLVCARSAESVARVEAQYRLSGGSPRLEDILAAGPRAALVLSSTATHYPIAERLLEAGIDVFLEKPAALRAEQTRRLAELAEARGRILMVGFNRRFAPLHVQARQVWQTRRPGLAVFQKVRAGSHYANMAQQFIDDAIHQVDILRFFCGDGQVCAAVQQTGADGFKQAICTVALAGGGLAQVAVCTHGGHWAETYQLHGAGASLRIDAFEQVTLQADGREQRWQEPYASAWRGIPAARGFVAQVEHFLACVETREQPASDGWEAFKTQTLLEDMLRMAGGGLETL